MAKRQRDVTTDGLKRRPMVENLNRRLGDNRLCSFTGEASATEFIRVKTTPDVWRSELSKLSLTAVRALAAAQRRCFVLTTSKLAVDSPSLLSLSPCRAYIWHGLRSVSAANIVHCTALHIRMKFSQASWSSFCIHHCPFFGVLGLYMLKYSGAGHQPWNRCPLPPQPGCGGNRFWIFYFSCIDINSWHVWEEDMPIIIIIPCII